MTSTSYLDRTDWWTNIDSLPVPRIAATQHVDPAPGRGACMGEVHAAILKALQCAGVITNGAVRDLPAVSKLDFPMFAPFVAVSHAYISAELPEAAARIRSKEQRIVQVRLSPGFSTEKLLNEIRSDQ